jgi:hypothetical protein
VFLAELGCEGMMEVIVKLSPKLATAVRHHAATATDAILKQLNLELRPMHPQRATGPLSTYFAVDAPSELVEKLRTELPTVDGVEAAYVAPPPGLPQDR